MQVLAITFCNYSVKMDDLEGCGLILIPQFQEYVCSNAEEDREHLTERWGAVGLSAAKCSGQYYADAANIAKDGGG